NLRFEVGAAGFDLVRGRIPVLRRGALHHVGDVAPRPVDPDLLENQPVQELARTPDERLAGEILVAARSLTHEEQRGSGIPYPEDDLGPRAGQCAPGTRARRGAQLLPGRASAGKRHSAVFIRLIALRGSAA